ncbi:MAG: hypothetical protein LUG93_18285 [Lachnospiraceae bacterium]|nr:hypothetical protein [Lachnospiraceae bacterium]
MRIIIIVVILLGAAVGFGACSEMKGGPGKALEAMVHMLPGAHDSKSTDSSDKTDDEGNGIAIEMEILMPGNG